MSRGLTFDPKSVVVAFLSGAHERPWIAQSLERVRGLSDHRTILSKTGISADEFLEALRLTCLGQDLGFIDKLLRDVAQSGGLARGMPWIGPAGSFTQLHHDLTNNPLLQIQRRKRLLLIAPSETPRLYNDHHVYSRIRDLAEPGLVERFSALEGLNLHQVVLGPGEALFIPLGWWRQVAALDFSVTLTHTNFRWPNDFHKADQN